MDVPHFCRLCLKTSGYHFNMFTEIISDKHLYQLINSICELEIFRNDGLPEHICQNCFQSIRKIISFKTKAKETEAALTRMKRFRNMIITKEKEKEEVEDNEEAMDPDFHHSTVKQEEISAISLGGNTSSEEQKSLFQETEAVLSYANVIEDDTMASDAMDLPSGMLVIKSEIDIDEIASPAEQFEIQKITEMEESAFLENFNEEIIQAGKKKSESQEFLEVRRMECYLCGEKKETKQGIAQHIEDAHNSNFNKDNTSIQQQRKDKQYTCSMCERNFKVKSALTRHMLIHTGKKPFQCNICNYSCSRSGHLKVHMQNHTGEKPFQCHVCTFRSSRSGDLKVHMQNHTGEKPFQCHFCTFRSSRNGDLKVHMQIHTEEKSFQCSVCSYGCSRSWDLKVHMRKHTGEKPYQCNICNYSCSRNRNLKCHMQLHTGEKSFQCSVCSYGCSRKWDLKIHMRKHTGERPFQCNVCNYSFPQSWHLKRHLQKHYREKKFNVQST